MIGSFRSLRKFQISSKLSRMIAEQGKRTIESKEGELTKSGKIGGEFKISPNPEFIPHRITIFEQLLKEQEDFYSKIEKPEITITLPDGKEVKGKAFETTAYDIAVGISKGLADACVGAKVLYTKVYPNPLNSSFVGAEMEEDHGHCCGSEGPIIHDLHQKLEGDCKLELLKFDSKDGKQIFWHSSAHIIGQAIENLYGGYLTHGPPLESGFFYDFYFGESRIVPDNYKDIEESANKIIKENQPFVKLIIKKEQALEMFKHNPFKTAFINSKIPDGAATSVYRSGNLIDLCTGPHVPATGKIKALKVMNSSSSYWLADATNDSLQRLYGVSFPSKKELTDHVKMLEELEKRDHRHLGEVQKLFTFTKYAPGCPNFLPHGSKIYGKLCGLIRKEYHARGFTEVQSSILNSEQLWMTSGHYFKYRDNMYSLKSTENTILGIKPMNCPIHCAIFDQGIHSYRDLPIRFSDFGVLHRNEIHGALMGMTRCRQFHQDDAHIFCTEDQILEEIIGCLDFLEYVYSVFGFSYHLELSTRPELRVGSDEIWDKAETVLTSALKDFGKPFTIGVGEGAFYGPKIDIKVRDCYNREHQLGTIQLDFNLPERFNLQYRASDDANEEKTHQISDAELHEKVLAIKKEDNHIEMEKQYKHRLSLGEEVTMEQIVKEYKIPDYQVSGKLKPGFKRPIMIHRAICGSLERCFAILTENFGGKWPFWLSPRQAIVIPISEKFAEYADKVYNRLKFEGYYVDVDQSSSGINKKVRNAQMQQYNYILVVGEKELQSGSVTLRERDQPKPTGEFSVESIVQLFKSQSPSESKAWAKLREGSFFEPKCEVLEALNKELSDRVYLSGDGVEYGDADKAAYEEHKDKEINAVKYPNASRWKKFIASKHSA